MYIYIYIYERLVKATQAIKTQKTDRHKGTCIGVSPPRCFSPSCKAMDMMKNGVSFSLAFGTGSNLPVVISAGRREGIFEMNRI